MLILDLWFYRCYVGYTGSYTGAAGGCDIAVKAHKPSYLAYALGLVMTL